MSMQLNIEGQKLDRQLDIIYDVAIKHTGFGDTIKDPIERQKVLVAQILFVRML